MDGCHLGHQEMIHVLIDEAKKRDLTPLILTFDPHPVHFFGKGETLKLLSTLDEKKQLLTDYEVAVEVIGFTNELSQLSPEQYIEDVLIGQFNAKCWLTGFNHQFGKKSTRRSCEDLNFFLNSIGLERVVVNEVNLNNRSISSSVIRALISESHIQEANELLGHPFTLSGPVVHGDKIGAQLGFRTANIGIEDENKLIPPVGVYGGMCLIDGEKHIAAINVGYRPTFNGQDLRIEAHLLDFSGDIYSQNAIIQLHLHVRDELSFKSTEGLKSQISQDIQKIRDYFKP